MGYLEYTIFDTGYDQFLNKTQDTDSVNALLSSSVENSLPYQGGLADINSTFTAPATLASGSLATNIAYTGGEANVAHFEVGTGSNLAGLNSANASTDVAIWAGNTYANRATAPFRVTAAGALTATSATITGALTTGSSSVIDGQYISAGTVASTAVNLALRGWTQTSAFSVTDADTVAWGAGTFTASDGTAYSIGAGNTGNMAAKTYIYLDIAVSTTAYQTTTTATTAVGNGKVMVAIAQNATGEATFMVLNNNSYNIDAANIVANSITANEIAASTITGTQISTLSISGKSCTFDTGTVGGFTMGATTLTATNLSLTAGAANTANISVGTGSNLAGLNSANAASDIAFWAGDTFANRATAPFRVDAAGNLTATSTSITGNTSWSPTASDTLRQSANNERTDTNAAYTLAKQINVGAGMWAGTGTLRIAFDLKMAPNAFSQTAYGKIYRNGGAVGTERTTTDTSNFTNYSEDISGWSAGDQIQLYTKDNGSPTGAICRNFRVYYTRTQNTELTVIQN